MLQENLPVVQVFISMQTQWRSGMAGPSGLDYAALPAVFDLHSIRKKRRADVFAGLRVMECETLGIWADRRERR